MVKEVGEGGGVVVWGGSDGPREFRCEKRRRGKVAEGGMEGEKRVRGEAGIRGAEVGSKNAARGTTGN